jgi:serine/threonine protein kinase
MIQMPICVASCVANGGELRNRENGKKKSKNDLTTSKVGTLIFQSPEKYKREQYYTDDDMWSLGIIIYELITLEHPFNLKNNFENNLLNGKYPPLGENVEEEFKQLVDNLLKVNGKDRPSAIEVLNMDFIKKRIKVLLDTKQITKEDIPRELYAVIMAVTDYSKINTENINTPIKIDAKPTAQNHRYSESFQIFNSDSPRETITQRVSKESELLINKVINNRMSKSQAEKYREVSNNLIRNIGNDAFNNLLNLAKKHDNYGLNDFKENIKLSLQIDHKSISEIDKTLKLIDDIYSIIKSIC